MTASESLSKRLVVWFVSNYSLLLLLFFISCLIQACDISTILKLKIIEEKQTQFKAILLAIA